jgi:outer membrane receptor for ferrienterochelin and colicins
MSVICRIGVIAIFSCWFSLPEEAMAQARARVDSDSLDFTELSLEDLGKITVPVVVGASKHEQKTTEAPSAVSVVTAEDIRHFGYRTLGDLLRSVRGFYVTSDRAYNFTGLRGVNRPGDFGGRVLINVDGHRLNEPIYDSAFTDTDFLLDLGLVERVEIIRGPGSSLYGNNAFFTVINVVTRRGSDLKGSEASVAAGSYDTLTGRLSYGGTFRASGVELLLSGTYHDSDGHERLSYPEFATTNNGQAERLDGSQAKSGYAALRLGDFKLSAGHVDRRKRIPTAQYGTIFGDPNQVYRDVRTYAELKYEHTAMSGWMWQVRSYYDAYRYEGLLAFDYPPVTLNRDAMEARWGGLDVLVATMVGRRHRLTLGADLRRDFLLSVRNFDVTPEADYVNSRRDEQTLAAYVQDEVQMAANLSFVAGARFDHFSTFGGTTNPRGAVVYSPWAEGAFKFLHGQAFRAPNAYEIDYIQPSFKANPALQPERIRSYEVVFEQGLGGNLRANSSVFLNRINGLIGQSVDDRDGLNFFGNLQQVEVRGFEAELEGRWARGLRTRLSYTYADARDTTTGDGLDNSPRHLGKGSAVVPVWGSKIFAGAAGDEQSQHGAGQPRAGLRDG